MEERGQFTLYRSHWAAIQRIRKAEHRAAAYDALCDYALNGVLPDLDKLPDAAAIVFDMAKPVLDSSRKKSLSGKKGGEKSGSPEPEAERVQSEPCAGRVPKTQNALGEGKKDRKPKGKKETLSLAESYTVLSENPRLDAELKETVCKWLRYKDERRENYVPSGLESLLTQLYNYSSFYGAQAVIDIINYSMGNGYQGIVLDRLKSSSTGYSKNRVDGIDEVDF